ncbi:MAG TPA: hypothetical protein VFV87_00760 [Pirellulaceae bacterium]|nr:hypothetical protein [Pirellulaceae bacterium]
MDTPSADEESYRLLNDNLRTDYGECPFVVDAAFQSSVTVEHFSGGDDATYVFVSRGLAWSDSSRAAKPTIRFAPFVAGTDIIYDVTEATLQGKARPFECDLRQHSRKIYALMPFQVEVIQVSYRIVRDDRHALISFHDARGERIRAVSPFEFQTDFDPGKTCVINYGVPKRLRATGRDGVYTEVLRGPQMTPGTQTFLVRSLLTGNQQKAAFSAWSTVVPVVPSE